MYRSSRVFLFNQIYLYRKQNSRAIFVMQVAVSLELTSPKTGWTSLENKRWHIFRRKKNTNIPGPLKRGFSQKFSSGVQLSASRRNVEESEGGGCKAKEKSRQSIDRRVRKRLPVRSRKYFRSQPGSSRNPDWDGLFRTGARASVARTRPITR